MSARKLKIIKALTLLCNEISKEGGNVFVMAEIPGTGGLCISDAMDIDFAQDLETKIHDILDEMEADEIHMTVNRLIEQIDEDYIQDLLN